MNPTSIFLVYLCRGEIQAHAVLHAFMGQYRSLRFNCEEAVL